MSDDGELRSFPWTSRLPLHLMSTDEERSVTSVRDNFLRGNTNLTEIHFTGLGSLTATGDYFLFGCTSLTNIDFTGLGSLTTAGVRFLGRCSSLSEIGLTGLDTVRLIVTYIHSAELVYYFTVDASSHRCSVDMCCVVVFSFYVCSVEQ